MEKELKANDLFAREEVKKTSLKKEMEIADRVEKAPSVPSEYITVKLSSGGKLGFPAIVHARDYTFDEAIKMAEISEENVTDSLVEIVNNIIFEDVDVRNAHRQDILEILLSVYGTWYSPTIESFRYYVNPDLPEDERDKKENISVATIPINAIKTIPLADSIKTPIRIAKGDFTIDLILPRVGNEIIASKFLEEKYAEEENKMNEIIKKARAEKATTEEQEIYDELQKRKGRDFLRVAQSLLIESYNGRKLETVGEKLEVVSKVPLNVWAIFNNELKNNFNFGIDSEVEFVCSVTHKPIKRRFHFREINFLPSMVQEDHSGFSVSFG